MASTGSSKGRPESGRGRSATGQARRAGRRFKPPLPAARPLPERRREKREDRSIVMSRQPLRIVVTADPYLPVPPRLYGGIERIIDFLVRGLVQRGHQVTLI